MSWLRHDDRFAEHRKILALERADRWTWVEVLCYCARQQDDGRVPDGIGDMLLHATPAFVERCVEVGLIDRDKDGTMTVHDWREYNGRDALEREQARKRKRQQRDKTVTEPGHERDMSVTSGGQERDVPRAGAQQRARVPSRPVSSSPTTSSELPRANDDDDLLQRLDNLTPSEPELLQRLDNLTPSTTQRLRWTFAVRDNPGLVERQLDAAVLNGRNPAALFDDLVQRNVDPGATNGPAVFTYQEPDPDTVAAGEELLAKQGSWVSAEDEMRKRVADLQAQVAERRAGR